MIRTATYKINTNRTNVTFRIGIILKQQNHQQKYLKKKKLLTANLRSRHDFPTPESPIKSNLNK